MKKNILIVFLLCCSISFGQTAKTPAKPVSHPVVKPAEKPAPAASPTGTVTQDEVESFLKHMFGFQPGVTFKVTEISAMPNMPGVTRVVVQAGDASQGSQVLYVMPGGQFAMAGDVIPFGVDPFAPVQGKLAAEAHGATLGNKDAAVTIVEFSDLQCPHCKLAQPLIEKLVAESPNAKLIYQPFPLPMHPWAKQAAAYAECVNRQSTDAMWKFTDAVYAAQTDITEANATEKFNGLATAAGADATKVAVCAVEPAVAQKIQSSIDLGLSIDVNSTPTLFIQGRRVLGINAESLPTLKAMIDYEAVQQKK